MKKLSLNKTSIIGVFSALGVCLFTINGYSSDSQEQTSNSLTSNLEGNNRQMVITEDSIFPKADVDYDYFEELTKTVKAHRAERLISFKTFKDYSKAPNTIILDTRSKNRYNKMHIKGAVHINFSDFTQSYLAEVIPDKNTRILIYCNNNFAQDKPVIIENFPTKAVYPTDFSTINIEPKKTLALNIPTYINLFGYGYENVYELNELINSNRSDLELKGTDILKLEE